MRRRFSIFLFILMGMAPSASAQSAPEGWRWITDTPAALVSESGATDSTLYFVTMAPGWHVTTGPRTMVFNPAVSARDRFSIEAGIYLFPDAGDAEYGLFMGGRGDQGGSIAFVLRRDGASAVLLRAADASDEVLVPWAVREGPLPQGEHPVYNVLRVEASPGALTFAVNDSTLATLPRTEGLAEGWFGFRIGPAMNLHIKSLDYTQHLALPAK